MSKGKSTTAPAGRAPGRPRSAAARAKALAAAREIIAEVGPLRLTVEEVARRAGVGKPTIYRTWANAREIAMEALAGDAGAEAPRPSGEPPAGAFAALIRRTVSRLSSRHGRQMALMLAGADPDSEIFRAFANRVVLEGRREGLALLRKAQGEGALDAGLSAEAAVDMAFGAIMARLLLRHEALDDRLAEEAVAVIFGTGRGGA